MLLREALAYGEEILGLEGCAADQTAVDVLLGEDLGSVRRLAYEQYIRDNKAFYSLNRGDGIESAALMRPEQPDEAMLRQERDELIHAALSALSDKQRRRIYQCIIDGKRRSVVAQTECVTEKAVRKSIKRGLSATKVFLKKFGF